MSGLSLIGAAWVHVVIRSYRNFQILFLVAIVIAEEQAESAILVFEPSFKSARNALAGIVPRLGRQTLRPRERRASQSDYGTKNT